SATARDGSMSGSCLSKSGRLMLAGVARAFPASARSDTPPATARLAEEPEAKRRQARVGGPERAALHWICAIALSGLILDASTDLPLVQAVQNKDIVDVNATGGDGTTALHWASHRDDLDIADALIRSGARVNAANDLGATSLHLACTNRSAPMVERQPHPGATTRAAPMGERLLTAGGTPNASLLNGETVLMTCARAGDARAVKALLARGADVNAKEREHQQTSLMWATAQRHPAVVQLLTDAD